MVKRSEPNRFHRMILDPKTLSTIKRLCNREDLNGDKVIEVLMGMVEGNLQCRNCGNFYPEEFFYLQKNQIKRNGRGLYCKECHKIKFPQTSRGK